MCAGSGAGGGAMGQQSSMGGFSPYMGSMSPMGSGQLQSAGMGMGSPMQRQSPYMGSGGPQQSTMGKIDPFYTPGVAPPMPDQGQMGRVDRFAGTGGAPMPTGDAFGAQSRLMGAQGAYGAQQSPMDLQTSQLQRAMGPWQSWAGGQQGPAQQSYSQQGGGYQRQSPFMGMNPDFNQIMSALQGMGGRQV